MADNSSLSLSGVTGWLSATEVPAAGRALGVTESHLAGEVGKASGEQGTGTISKGGGHKCCICFVPWAADEYPCNSWACICHAAVAWRYLNILCVVLGASGFM